MRGQVYCFGYGYREEVPVRDICTAKGRWSDANVPRVRKFAVQICLLCSIYEYICSNIYMYNIIDIDIDVYIYIYICV